MAAQISAAIASADFSVSRRRPGSPWMPTPNSISPSPISNIGLPAAGTVQEVSATPIERVALLTRSPSALSVGEIAALLGRGADDLFDHQRAGDAATASGVERVLDRNVVVDDDLVDRPGRHFGGHLEVHHVALVVLDDQQHAGAGVDLGGGLHHLVGRRRGEDLAGAGGIEHAVPDEAGMERLVTRAAAREQRDLARLQHPAPDEFVAAAELDDVGMRRRRSHRGSR